MWALGGCKRDVTFGRRVLGGGELGGVMVWETLGMGPGGQYAMCLLGTGVVERGMLMFSEVRGDVFVACWYAGCCCTTMVAIAKLVV